MKIGRAKKALKKSLHQFKSRQPAASTPSKQIDPSSSIHVAPPFRRQYKSPYTIHDRILLIGEGNFSFAVALYRNITLDLVEDMVVDLVATTLDTEEITEQKYPNAKANIQFLRSHSVPVFFEVDATNLYPLRNHSDFQAPFDKIVFNFPHVGLGICNQDRNILANQKVLIGFFQQCLKFMESKGEVHVTMKDGPPYDSWNIRKLAKSASNLNCKVTFPFNPTLYPGYEHRRTLGFSPSVSSVNNYEIYGKVKSRTSIFILSDST